MKKSSFFLRIVSVLCVILLLTGCSAAGDGSSQSQSSDNTSQSQQQGHSPLFGTKKLIADALQAPTGEPTGDLMSFVHYAMSELSFDTQSVYDGHYGYSYDGHAYEIAKRYVDLLCTEYEFETVGEPYYEAYDTGAYFFDFVLRYTGSSVVTTGAAEGNFSKNVGDIAIYGLYASHSAEGQIEIDCNLAESDDGFRYGADKADTTPIGESLYTGLYRMPDKRYQTEDGRLSVSLGKTLMIADGKEAEYDARYEIDIDNGKLRVITENQYEAVMQHFYIPTTEDWTVGLYAADKFAQDAGFAISCRGVAEKEPRYTWPSMFANFHNDSYVYPIFAMSGEMTALSLRLIYRDDETAVFYTCSSYQTAPYLIETLTAVSLDVEPTKQENSSSGGGGIDFSDAPSKDKNPCLRCDGTGYRSCGACGGDGIMDASKERCSIIGCRGGEIKCSTCGGDGER